MSEKSNAVVMYDDLELLTRFLNQQLDPERVAQVRQRLEDDPAFRDFAAPVLLAWSVPPRWKREPLPAGELEKNWDEFTKRAGFAHQRRKTRRRRLWLLAVLAVMIGIPALFYRSEIRTAYRDWRDFRTVAYDTGWIELREGHEVRLAPGARLRSSSRQSAGGGYTARLEGSARFRIQHPDSGGIVPGLLPLMVETRGGAAFNGMGEFTVTTRGDSTEVEVHRPNIRRAFGWFPLPTMVLVRSTTDANPISLYELQRALLVRGAKPLRLEPRAESREP